MKYRQLLPAAFVLLLSGCGIFGDLERETLAGGTGLKITYDINGGGGTAPQDSNTYTTGTRVTAQSAPANGTPPSGATAFYGWSTSPDGYGAFHAADSAFTITENTKLYALWQGDGTNPGHPKLGSTKDDLKAIGRNDHFALVSDVNGMDSSIDTAPNHIFSGTFDGRGHTVTLDIQKTGSVTPRQIGLFYSIDGAAVIKNVHVAGTITVDDTNSMTSLYIGGIAGFIWENSISLKNCVSSVNITAKSPSGNFFAGGLAGLANGITVEHCYSYAMISMNGSTLTGYMGAGGITGAFALSSGQTPGRISNAVSLSDITWTIGSRVFVPGIPGARGIAGGIRPGSTNNIVFTNNHARGTLVMQDKNGPVTQAADNNFDGISAAPADIESEAWWRNTAGWEAVWGGANPAIDKPWVWDASAKRPRLHKFD